MSFASPRECSGNHASSRELAAFDVAEDAVPGLESGAGFCCNRAIYPGILSFAEGVG